MTNINDVPYKVMVVDDSLVIRGLINRMIQTDPMINVVKSVGNGQFALNEIERDKSIEVVILDIEMPVMDGLKALPLILAANPNIQVIMSSTLTERNAEISMKALSLGASDYIAKPSSTTELNGNNIYKEDLIEKIKTFGKKARLKASRFTTQVKEDKSFVLKSPNLNKVDEPLKTIPKKSLYDQAFKLIKPNFKMVPEIVAIGSSTGGPPALFKMFGEIKTSIKQPIIITQHMPPTFTKILAEHIERISGKKALEAQDGMLIEDGKVYIAPGGFHMVVGRENDKNVLKINSDPPENFCRPAVDPMFRSVAKYYGTKVLAIVLTGMGSDGAKGAKYIVEAGGNVIAQDEATSVVWGMPGATAQMGVCCAVLPLNEIVGYVKGVL